MGTLTVLDLKGLEEALGYGFRQPERLLEALTHPSYVAERANAGADNQRLEFLGDAVLQLVMTTWLYRRHPDLAEGRLTQLRSTLTNEEALARMARILGLGAWLRLGKGEVSGGGAERASTLADAVEAVVGAVYLDGGLPAAETFLLRLLAALPDPETLMEEENPKGRLQELTQEKFGAPPAYEVLDVTGPDHQPEFEVRVMLKGEPLATARAGSRRLAEKAAAKLALDKLKG
jgi:ribonuclease-3